MTTVTQHAAGVPSWIDLATPDPDASKEFYSALFGWDYDDQPSGRPGTEYVMASKGSSSAAGMMQLAPEMAAAGMPPVWSTYVTVDVVDAVVARVEAAGGTVMRPAVDVTEAGRMAVVADPAGAVICLWQPNEHIGCEVVNEPGAFSWSELITPDPEGVADFYRHVFGWTHQTTPMPNGAYTVFAVEGGNPGGIAGAMAPPVEGMPPVWGVYFMVDDAAATVEAARERDAQVVLEPTEVPGVGVLATIVDPQGAAFSIMQPAG